MSAKQRSPPGGISTDSVPELDDEDRTNRFDQNQLDEYCEREIVLPADGLIDERYRVLDRVGDGGMGVVLRVFDERLQREVALKIIRPHLTHDRELVEQFLAEARAMAQLRHPNVVEIHDFGEYKNLPYFAMRFIDGHDLHSWVRGQSLPLPVDVALGLLGQICDGVAAIHDAGVVHRDIKPENILIDRSFRVVVTDFGLVRPMDEEPSYSAFQVTGGTAGYMAPELASEFEVEIELAPRADVYALGIIAYWLLVGRHPFIATTRKEMLDHQINAPVPMPSDLRPDLSPALDPVILDALRKDPRHRIANARILADRLREARQEIGRTKAKVVIVDEDGGSLLWVHDVLSETLPDAEITCVTDSNEALDVIERDPPGLVLTALENQGVSGFELAATLRGNPMTQAIPIVVLSSNGGAAEWQALWRIGVDAFVLKPLVRHALVPLVTGLLPRPSTRRRRRSKKSKADWRTR